MWRLIEQHGTIQMMADVQMPNTIISSRPFLQCGQAVTVAYYCVKIV